MFVVLVLNVGFLAIRICGISIDDQSRGETQLKGHTAGACILLIVMSLPQLHSLKKNLTFSLANGNIYSDESVKNAPDTSSRLITAFEHES